MSLVIKRIRLENVRGIGEVEIEIPSSGVTVIEAPNESGKSTLFDAIDILFELKSSSGAAKVKALQPVGKDVSSRIEADIVIGPYSLTYAKQFNRDKKTELTIHSPQREQLTGDDAHNRVEQLLEMHVDTVLLKSLWIQQGRGLDVIELDRSTAVARALGSNPDETASIGNVDNPDGDDEADESLLDRVEQEFLKYFTKTGQPNKAMKETVEAVASAEAQVEELQQRVADIESLAEEQVTVIADIQRSTHDLENAKNSQAELETRLNQVRDQKSKLDRIVADIDIAGERLTVLQHREQQRVEWETSAVALQTRRDELGERVSTQTNVVAELVARVEARKLERVAFEDAAQKAEQEREQAERTVAFISAQREHEALQERLDQIETAQRTLNAAQSALEANTVTPKHVKAIQTALETLSVAEAQLNMAAPTVKITARNDLQTEINGEAVGLSAGQVHESAVAGHFNVDIANVVSIEVASGSSLDELNAAVATAAEQRDEALHAAKVSSLADAELALEQRRLAESDKSAAEQLVTTLLDGATREELFDKSLKLQAVANQIVGNDSDVLDAGEIDESTARQRLDDLILAEREATAAQRKVQQQLDSINEELSQERTQLVGLTTERATVQSQLDQIRESQRRARIELSDDDLSRLVQQQKETLAALTDERTAIEALLTQLDATSVEMLHDNAVRRLQDAQTRITELQTRETQIATSLEVLGGTGLGEELAEAQVALERVSQTERQVRGRANAAKLLKQHLEAARSQVFDTYRAPLKKRINALGRVVFDPTFDVEIDDAFEITTRTMKGNTLTRSALSSGAQEQLSVLTAVAAAQLASDGGVPLVLDDTLGFSDPDRMERVGAVLSQVDDAQVIVLTCVPARFETIGGANRISLLQALRDRR